MGNPNYVLLTVVLKYEDPVFNLECLSKPNPNPRDSGICRKLQNKLKVDLLNIVQLKLAPRREREVKLGELSSSAFFVFGLRSIIQIYCSEISHLTYTVTSLAFC